LKEASEFVGQDLSGNKYYGADYDINETNEAHAHNNHRYKISKTIMNSNVFINIPKLKTHKKAGITCSLKNLVGINTYKNYLPHYILGTPFSGGDEFPTDTLKNMSETVLLKIFKNFAYRFQAPAELLMFIKKIGKSIFGETKSTIRSGNWHGNDTLWRTVLDLNKIILFGMENGSLINSNEFSPRKYISVVDAVHSGEGNGPEAPDPVNTGFILLGTNPVAVDCVAAKIIGFDFEKVPSLKSAFKIKYYPICDFEYSDIELRSCTMQDMNENICSLQHLFSFEPADGWKNHIELKVHDPKK
jgi:hypothetical protein